MLLGDDSIDNLSASELAVILLSAYWHDLGMICNNDEEIKSEEWFDEYINKSYKHDGNLTPTIVSEYIRLNHHKRLEKYLYDRLDILNESEKNLYINEHDVIDMAYKVSMSHNENTKDLEKFKEYQSNHNQDDFIFCAILLRLADIMDFDNERTSNSSYKFLGLENPINSENQFSQKEWKKHLDSLGFSYDFEKKILHFKAIPKEPDTEFYIREFIKIIEDELNKCTQLFNSHCDKWRDIFKLPYEIDISGINSKSSYKFGDYKFSFDNNQVLDLLTGNNIYSDPMIFVRELLQNSIDASLYRESLEKEKGKSDFKCKPINVTDWHDKDGNYWIRFDDYGLGMDEYVLLNYFTKIGKSFYESKDFNKELGFKAISRFGIGILSCFMVANRIEVSTKKEDCEAIRFSIKSLYSYFVTQLENIHRNVTSFPSSDDSKVEKYRKDIGTSIAIQIDFNKLNRWFEIKKELLRHIFYSPVEIQYKNEKIGTTIDELEKNPWIEEEIIIELSKEDSSQIKSLFKIQNTKEKFKLKVIPINLSKYSISNNIKAQMLRIEFMDIEDMKKSNITILIKNRNDSLSLILKNNKREKIIKLNKYEVLSKLNLKASSKVTHNGIINEKFKLSRYEDIFNSNSKRNNIYEIIYISLLNEYRPILDISRSNNIDYDFKTVSHVNLMLANYFNEYPSIYKQQDFNILNLKRNITIEEILSDVRINDWQKAKILSISNDEHLCLEEIKKLLIEKSEIKIINDLQIGKETSHFRNIFIKILLCLFAEIVLNKDKIVIIKKIYDEIHDVKIYQYFSLGFFVDYDESINKYLQLKRFPINKNHLFSIWFLKNAETLNNNYKGIFEDIKNIFSHTYYKGIEKFERLDSLLRLLQKLKPNIIDDEIIKSIEVLKEGN